MNNGSICNHYTPIYSYLFCTTIIYLNYKYVKGRTVNHMGSPHLKKQFIFHIDKYIDSIFADVGNCILPLWMGYQQSVRLNERIPMWDQYYHGPPRMENMSDVTSKFGAN